MKHDDPDRCPKCHLLLKGDGKCWSCQKTPDEVRRIWQDPRQLTLEDRQMEMRV